MLILCIEHRDRVVTKDEIFERVWRDVTVEEGNIAGIGVADQRIIRQECSQKCLRARLSLRGAG